MQSTQLQIEKLNLIEKIIHIEDENLIELENIEDETWLNEEFSIGKKVKINLCDMNTIGWKTDLKEDLNIALHILEDMKKVSPNHDTKLNVLKEQIKEKLENPINKNNKKIIIFDLFFC